MKQQQEISLETVQRRMELLTAGPVWKYLGIQLVLAENGQSEVRLPVKHEFTQLHGNVHGGILATLSDASMAAAINSLLPEHEFVVTTEMHVNYLSPAAGRELIGKARVIKRGRTLSLCEADVYDERGKLLCHATATFYSFEKRE